MSPGGHPIFVGFLNLQVSCLEEIREFRVSQKCVTYTWGESNTNFDFLGNVEPDREFQNPQMRENRVFVNVDDREYKMFYITIR